MFFSLNASFFPLETVVTTRKMLRPRDNKKASSRLTRDSKKVAKSRENNRLRASSRKGSKRVMNRDKKEASDVNFRTTTTTSRLLIVMFVKLATALLQTKTNRRTQKVT